MGKYCARIPESNLVSSYARFQDRMAPVQGGRKIRVPKRFKVSVSRLDQFRKQAGVL